jgi:hypothetical protein
MLKLFLRVALSVVVGIVACGTSSSNNNSGGTWMVDCVAVLGAPRPSGQIPLAAVPYSGLPRDEVLGQLTDEQLGQLADFEVCLEINGYRHDCCSDTYCPPTAPDPPIGSFVLRTVPLIANAVYTCYPDSPGDASAPSREAQVTFYRNNYGNCHVGLYEDCDRERASDPLGLAGWGPDCWEVNSLCGAI